MTSRLGTEKTVIFFYSVLGWPVFVSLMAGVLRYIDAKINSETLSDQNFFFTKFEYEYQNNCAAKAYFYCPTMN